MNSTRNIILLLVILFSFSMALADTTTVKPIDNSGVYWGVTFKKNLEPKNSVLEAGYVWDVGKGTYLAGGLEYENSLTTYGPNVYVFKKIKQRFYGLAGIGTSFYETKFNNTSSLTIGVAYVPDIKLFGTIDIIVIPRYQYTGYSGFTDEAEKGNKPPLVDNKTSEIWLTFIMLGW